VLPKDLLIALLDKLLVGVPAGNEKNELAEEDVVLVDFLEV
jgi:hypothetical protein